MTLAHELCHLLHDREPGTPLGIVSNPRWAPQPLERRANAFAAMLLAPEEALLRLMPRDSSSWTPSLLRGALEALGVGPTVLTWQLHNLGWITDSERSAWLDELCWWR